MLLTFAAYDVPMAQSAVRWRENLIEAAPAGPAAPVATGPAARNKPAPARRRAWRSGVLGAVVLALLAVAAGAVRALRPAGPATQLPVSGRIEASLDCCMPRCQAWASLENG